jgi:hypothetical protein
MRRVPVSRSLSLASLAGGAAALWLGCAGTAPADAPGPATSNAAETRAEASGSAAGVTTTQRTTPGEPSPDAAVDVPGDVSSPAPERGTLVPQVALARFTTAVEDREPVDSVSFLPNEEREVLFYTDLRGLEGSTVLHRWEYAGEVVAEVRFDVHSPRWRVWSSKALQPEWIGDWTASVIGPGGEVLAIETFTYQDAR